ELHDALQTFISFPANKANPEWHDYCKILLSTGRAGSIIIDGEEFWFATEKAERFEALYKNQDEASYADLVRGWMLHIGPITVSELCEILKVEHTLLENAFLKAEASGFILRGPQIGWCERRLLARIHRLTISILRKEIEPASPAEFMEWLNKWQHV